MEVGCLAAYFHDLALAKAGVIARDDPCPVKLAAHVGTDPNPHRINNELSVFDRVLVEAFMRIATALLLLAGLSIAKPSLADPYRWCAVYGGGQDGGSTNCYFVTLEQCRAAISGNGGFCTPNGFYDGRPVTTPEDGIRYRGRSRAH